MVLESYHVQFCVGRAALRPVLKTATAEQLLLAADRTHMAP